MAAPPPIHLDHNATTPLSAAAREAMLPHLGPEPGNPSSLHATGRRARAAVEAARARVAALLGAPASEIVFTSGGTEALHLGIRGALEAAPAGKPRVVASAVEHGAVRDLLRHLRGTGSIDLVAIAPGRDGALDAEKVLAAAGADAALVAVMAANNETGILHPVAAIGRACRERGIPFLCDAVQAAGKVPVDGEAIPADLVAISAHKLGGPTGAGALRIRRGARWKPPGGGGGQEGGRRPGTENVAGIAGFGAAAAEALAGLREGAAVAVLRDRLEEGILAAVPGARRAAAAPRVPNTALLLFPGLEGESLVLALDARGIAVSTGSACAAGDPEPSHVLVAMGIPKRDARGAVRFSLGRGTVAEEIDRAVAETVAAATPAARR